MRRSSRSGRGQSDPAPIVEATEEILACRTALATFLLGASKSLGGQPTHYLLRTNGWKSVSVLTCLPPLDYATVLLLCNLVTVDAKNDGTYKVNVSTDKWNGRFFRPYGLLGENERTGATSKMTKATLYPDALERKKRGDPPVIRDKKS